MTLNFCRVTMLYSGITDTNQLDLTQVTVNPGRDVYFTSSQNVLTFKDNSRIKPSNNISNLRETPTSWAYRVIHNKLHWRRITPPRPGVGPGRPVLRDVSLHKIICDEYR